MHTNTHAFPTNRHPVTKETWPVCGWSQNMQAQSSAVANTAHEQLLSLFPIKVISMPITRWWKTLKNVLVMKKKINLERAEAVYWRFFSAHFDEVRPCISESLSSVRFTFFFLEELHKYKPCSPVWPTARPQPREIGLTRCYNCDAELHVLFFFRQREWECKGSRSPTDPALQLWKLWI